MTWPGTLQCITVSYFAFSWPNMVKWYHSGIIIHFMIYCFLLGRILQLPKGKGHKRTSRSYMKVSHLTHPPIGIQKTATAPGSPYSFRIVCGFFYVQNYQHSRNCGTGPPAYRQSLSEKTRKSNHLQMKLQREHFLLSYWKTLSVGPVGVSNSRPPASQPGSQPSALLVLKVDSQVSQVWDQFSFIRTEPKKMLMIPLPIPSIALFLAIKEVKLIILGRVGMFNLLKVHVTHYTAQSPNTHDPGICYIQRHHSWLKQLILNC